MINEVIELSIEDIMDLRVQVLRKGTPSTHANYPEDTYHDVVHFGIVADGIVLATSTWFIKECPERIGMAAMQLKGMAVSFSLQSTGFGSKLITRGLQHAQDHAAECIWARARDSAIGFYERCGFEVVGDGFIDESTAMPHHIVLRAVLS